MIKRLAPLSLMIVVALLVGAVSNITLAQDDDNAAETLPVTLNFSPAINGELATCGTLYEGVGIDDATVSFNDFRLYVSNIHLLTTDGEAVPVTLEQDGLWQVENVALLDFEDGTASCSEIGNAALNGTIVGDVPAGDYTGLQFDMGVPFALNHLDVTTAESPLNIAALWWSWQGGYKFIRVDLMTHTGESDEAAPWNLHIGSTGCESAASVIAPEEPCSRPNVPTIVLESFDIATDAVLVDLGGLLSGVALYDGTPMPPGCMSGIDDPDCPMLYPGFGLSLDEGVCPDGDCSSQTFFSASPSDEVTLIDRVDDMGGMDMGTGGHDSHGDHGSDDEDGEDDHSGHGG